MTDDDQDQELVISEALPGIVSNRFIISQTRNGVRVAFGDQLREGGKTHFRSVIFMNEEDALALGEALVKHLGHDKKGH